MQGSVVLRAAVLTVAIALAATPVLAQSDEAGVTGAGEGIFTELATFNGVALSGLELGKGLFIASDGTAMGEFHAVLLGTSLLDQPQDIAVEGEVSTGFVAADGSAIFSGSATVDMGGGTLPLLGVPFTVTASPDGLQLILDVTNLPPAALAAGSITIE